MASWGRFSGGRRAAVDGRGRPASRMPPGLPPSPRLRARRCLRFALLPSGASGQFLAECSPCRRVPDKKVGLFLLPGNASPPEFAPASNEPGPTNQAQRADLRKPRARPWESTPQSPGSPEGAAPHDHERLSACRCLATVEPSTPRRPRARPLIPFGHPCGAAGRRFLCASFRLRA
jgi:hypothetical protein